jgi:hypothetical protein
MKKLRKSFYMFLPVWIVAFELERYEWRRPLPTTGEGWVLSALCVVGAWFVLLGIAFVIHEVLHEEK